MNLKRMKAFGPMKATVPWKSEVHYVSPFDFIAPIRKKFQGKKVTFHDVTLRDGEQQAGIVFRREEKVRIARALDEAGVDRIEAGLPSVSRDDAAAVKEIASLGLTAKVYAFARCMKPDVDAALKADVDGIVMEIPSSDHLIRHGYGWDEEKAVSLSVEATSYAHDHGLKVTFFTIDATRASFKVFRRLVGRVAEEGHMDSLAVADTFGVMNPEAVAYFVGKVSKLTDRPLEIHAHNDFGLALANSLAAFAAGAETVHVTVNGIGERSGNTSLEEGVMALRHLYGVRTRVDSRKLRGLSLLVQELSGVKVPPQKPVVGSGIFTIESGIVAGWWRRLEKKRMRLEMLPFVPGLVGHDRVRVVLGKKSGKDSVLYTAEHGGMMVREEDLDEALTRVKEESIRLKRELTDDEALKVVGEFDRSVRSRHAVAA